MGTERDARKGLGGNGGRENCYWDVKQINLFSKKEPNTSTFKLSFHAFHRHLSVCCRGSWVMYIWNMELNKMHDPFPKHFSYIFPYLKLCIHVFVQITLLLVNFQGRTFWKACPCYNVSHFKISIPSGWQRVKEEQNRRGEIFLFFQFSHSCF